MRRAFILCLLPLLTVAPLIAQNGSVQGKLKDPKLKEPVAFASVIITRETNPGADDSQKGTLSDIEGFYRIEAAAGDYMLTVSVIGYEKFTKRITLKKGEILFLDIDMVSNDIFLGDVVHTESKNIERPETSTISITTVSPQLIQSRNATSADMALEQIPGVSVVDAEPQIRGASGFSAGLGSKVLILIDDVPMLRGDAGRPVWNFLPLENMDQIDVIKGSASVIYGSGASNGVINIRTAFPKAKPEFMVSTFFGVYSPPSDPAKVPWTGDFGGHLALNTIFRRLGVKDAPPIKTGLNVFHSRIFKGKKMEVDFVIGGQALWDEGYRGGEPLEGNLPSPIDDFDTTRKNQGEYEKSVRMNVNTRFRIKKVQGLSFGVNTNAMYSRESQSFFWQNINAGMYRMLGGSLTNFENFMYYVDPYVTYIGKKGSKHYLRTRLYQSYSDGDVKANNQDTNRLGQDSRSTTVFGEYQYVKSFLSPAAMKWLLKDFNITAGLMGTYTHSFGGVFSGDADGDSSNYSVNFGAYAQLEKRFFSRLTLLLGTRLEYFRINEFNDIQPVFRAGANFRLTEGTFIRASWGQGFRFPTIGERFINTTSGGFGFFANDTLRPERSWSAEIGIRQMFKIKRAVVGYVDVAGFWQQYSNYVEFVYGLWKEGAGFRFFNTGRARIRGIDAAMGIQIFLPKKVSLELNGGYTYSLPQTLEPNFVFATYPKKDNITGDTIYVPITYANSISDTTIRSEGILKYRIQHTAKIDFAVNWKGLSVGFTARYYSTMRQIDNFFVFFTGQINPFEGLPEYLQEHKAGSWVFDARISYMIKGFKIAFIMENMLNREYSVRPLSPAAPRLTTLQLSYRI